MADEYISKQRAKDLMGCCLASAKAQYKAEKNEFKKARYGDYISTIQAMIDVVGAVEAADVQPVEHSKWICVNEDENVYMCDKCGGEVIFIEGNPTNNEYIYCMYCGAKMDMPEAIKGQFRI